MEVKDGKKRWGVAAQGREVVADGREVVVGGRRVQFLGLGDRQLWRKARPAVTAAQTFCGLKLFCFERPFTSGLRWEAVGSARVGGGGQ